MILSNVVSDCEDVNVIKEVFSIELFDFLRDNRTLRLLYITFGFS